VCVVLLWVEWCRLIGVCGFYVWGVVVCWWSLYRWVWGLLSGGVFFFMWACGFGIWEFLALCGVLVHWSNFISWVDFSACVGYFSSGACINYFFFWGVFINFIYGVFYKTCYVICNGSVLLFWGDRWWEGLIKETWKGDDMESGNTTGETVHSGGEVTIFTGKNMGSGNGTTG